MDIDDTGIQFERNNKRRRRMGHSESDTNMETDNIVSSFMTGKQKMYKDDVKKFGKSRAQKRLNSFCQSKPRNPGLSKKRTNNGGFANSNAPGFVKKAFEKQTKTTDPECNFDMDDERLKGNDPALLESIQNEMLVKKLNVTWDSIAGLEQQKRVLRESIIWPIKNPQLFTDDLLNPAKGVLLFGPPGTGKTLLGKAIANEVDATFFSISASSLTSKFFGQSSKLVKALFSLAEYHSPSVIFIDEIDSLLTKRGDKDFEASSRIKTEILIRMEGASTNTDSRVVVIGATNRPEQIDEAARRRLSQKLYIPLPELVSRRALIKHMLSKQKDGCTMSEDDIIEVAEKTEGFSGADLTELCR
eukprot:UN22320